MKLAAEKRFRKRVLLELNYETEEESEKEGEGEDEDNSSDSEHDINIEDLREVYLPPDKKIKQRQLKTEKQKAVAKESVLYMMTNQIRDDCTNLSD